MMFWRMICSLRDRSYDTRSNDTRLNDARSNDAKNKRQVKNKATVKVADLPTSSNDEEKVTAIVNFAETREIAERVLSVFIWNGH